MFARFKNPRQRCGDGCWSIAAIIAYDLSEDRVIQRTLLSGEQVAMGIARPVRGSNPFPR